jgi:hypothetical protein
MQRRPSEHQGARDGPPWIRPTHGEADRVSAYEPFRSPAHDTDFSNRSRRRVRGLKRRIEKVSRDGARLGPRKGMVRPVGFAKVGGWIALVLSVALVVRVVAIDNLEALVIVAPALIGAVMCIAWPLRRFVLGAAVVLIGITATLSLIGGIGFLYIPSIFLILRGVVRTVPAAS